MKTTVRTYHVFTDTPEGAKQWQELKSRLEKTNGKCFESWGNGYHYQEGLDGKTVDLNAAHVFDNQWTAEGVNIRLFDWALDFEPYGNKHLKQGHYLEITQEMRDLRDNTYTCGYCGYQELGSTRAFCPKCIGSQYLKAEDLRLTRMLPVSSKAKRAELTDEERAELMPLYVQAQTAQDNKAIIKERERVIAKHAKTTADATTERDACLWLLDRGLRTDNVIYYTHTNRFCFGWRSPLSGELLSRTLDILAEFPYDYDIKKA